jgi:hypothetical protein
MLGKTSRLTEPAMKIARPNHEKTSFSRFGEVEQRWRHLMSEFAPYDPPSMSMFHHILVQVESAGVSPAISHDTINCYRGYFGLLVGAGKSLEALLSEYNGRVCALFRDAELTAWNDTLLHYLPESDVDAVRRSIQQLLGQRSLPHMSPPKPSCSA